MARVPCFLLMILTLGLQLGATSQAESVSGALKEKYVQVRFSDLAGRTVRTLKPVEIQLTVAGEPMQITRVLGPGEPFSIGLMLDVSPSKEGEVDPIRQATSDFVSYFPLEYPMLVLTFDTEVYVDCDWTTDRKKVDEAIWEYGLHKSGGTTALRDGIVAALQQKFEDRRPRTAMILFTDGVDTGSEVASREESTDFLKGSAVLTYVIHHFSMRHYMNVNYPGRPEGLDPRNIPGPSGTSTSTGPIFIGRGNSEWDWANHKVKLLYESSSEYLRSVAQAGGGGYYHLASIGEMGNAYRKIATELLDVYTVFFKPSARETNEKFRTVRVTTTRNEVVGYARPKGYWVVTE